MYRFSLIRRVSSHLTLLFVVTAASAQGPAPKSGFAPFEQWKSAVISNDTSKLKQLYSTDPPVVVKTEQGEVKSPDPELKFWSASPNSGRLGVDFEIGKTETL